MGSAIRLLLVGILLLALTWSGLVVLARRLPPGAAKDLASVLPSCITMARRLRRDPRVPRRVKLVVGFACAGNTPPPTNAGQPNTAGSKSGQCATL